MSSELLSTHIAFEARNIAQEIIDGKPVGKVEASLILAAAVRIDELLARISAAQSRAFANETKIAALEADAARMDWIQKNLLCADFDYPIGDKTTSVLCVKWPEKVGISANVRASIDAAMKGGA